jgi:hypothetical protein
VTSVLRKYKNNSLALPELSVIPRENSKVEVYTGGGLIESQK